MSPQNLEGFVLYVSVERVFFHVVICSCLMSSAISLFSVESLLMISCVGGRRLSWFLSFILCRMYLFMPGVKFLTHPVGMCCLLLCVMMWVKCLVAVFMSVKRFMLKSRSACSMLLV